MDVQIFKNPISRQRQTYAVFGLVAIAALMPELAQAMAVPEANSFAYDIYDVGVNKLLKGAVGFLIGVAAIGWGATQVAKSWPIALLSIIAGSMFVKADAIVVSLGAVV